MAVRKACTTSLSETVRTPIPIERTVIARIEPREAAKTTQEIARISEPIELAPYSVTSLAIPRDHDAQRGLFYLIEVADDDCKIEHYLRSYDNVSHKMKVIVRNKIDHPRTIIVHF